MSHFNSQLKALVAILIALQLAACSKTVTWEEEVPLNTGETIWVHRRITYSLKGAGGNPFDIGYYPNKTEVLEFKWGGSNYIYEGYADLILLAISPQRRPVLVAPAANYSWDWGNDYHCTTPHYVQFVPDESRHKWSWPPKIEPWLYGMPSNLLGQRRKAEEMLPRYTAQRRSEEDAASLIQTPSRAKIDPTFIDRDCKKGS